MKTLTVDVECYINYFLVQFKDHETQKVVSVESLNDSELNRKRIHGIMSKNLTIGFNSNGYDLPMIWAAIRGFTNAQLKKLSDDIIVSGKAIWDIKKEYELEIPSKWAHIDIKDPSPGVMVSLKTYGGRLGAPKLQDLPIDPSNTISEQEAHDLSLYCENDLDTTWLLYEKVKHEIDLREVMGKELKKDLRSKGGAQVAKEYLMTKLALGFVRPPKYKAGHIIRYTAPSFIEFKTEQLKTLLTEVQSTEYPLKESGHITLPRHVSKVIPFDGAKYKIGIGGLHSQEKSQSIYADDQTQITLRDVQSYYPSLILELGIYPKQLGEKFLKLYRDIYNTRIKAKKEGDKYVSNSLKLVLNSSFGLFGNRYSPLYSPEMLLRVTLTGQLALLMLIEELSLAGIQTKSANTDGIVIHHTNDKESLADAICFEWELNTGFLLDTEFYRSMHSASVNSYIGLELGGGFKCKGLFADSGLTTNPQFNICSTAVKAYLKDNTPIEQTIRASIDITEFLSVRNVKGGGLWKDIYLGKVARWYWGIDGQQISYKTNGNKVPKSDGAIPCMDLPDTLPDNIDYVRYIDEANKILIEVGHNA